MTESDSPESKAQAKQVFYYSIAFKSLILVLIILIVAIVPMSYRYYQSSYNYELNVLSARLEFIAERGSALIDAEAVHSLRIPRQEYPRVQGGARRASAHQANSGVTTPSSCAGGLTAATNTSPPRTTGSRSARTPTSTSSSRHLQGHERYLEQGRDDALPALWRKGGDREFDQFLQLNTPLKLGGKVVAILVLNKVATPWPSRWRRTPSSCCASQSSWSPLASSSSG